MVNSEPKPCDSATVITLRRGVSESQGSDTTHYKTNYSVPVLVCVCVVVCVRVWLYVSVCVRIYIYIRTYIQTYARIHVLYAYAVCVRMYLCYE